MILCEIFLSEEEEKCMKIRALKYLKYPRDATPIPGPHLGRSELFNRSVSATTTNDLSRVVFSLFFLLLLLCIPRGIRSRLGEKKVLFFRAIFLQSDLSSKKAAQGKSFQ